MLTQHPKTIQIFLPDGNPRSLKIAEITSRTLQAILVPRNKLESAGHRPEIHNVGIYFLFGNEEEAKPSVYIGEAEECFQRLKNHHQSKEFWNTALVIVSKTNYFTKSHVKFLEHFSYQKANEIARFHVENATVPTESYVSEPVKADLLDNFDTFKTLLSTLGYPVFDEVKSAEPAEIFFCKGKNADAKGEYIDDGFVVFAGSFANLDETVSLHQSIRNLRNRLVEGKVLEDQDGVFRFVSDYIFNSPSAAADVVLGRSANGWTEWKDAKGKTLDVRKRN